MLRFLLNINFIAFSTILLAAQNSTNSNFVGQGDFADGMWVLANPIQEQIEGTPYLFNSWFQTGKLISGDKVYSINELNYNILAERFEARISELTVFALNHGSINKVEINGKTFTRHLDPEFQRNTYFENIIKFKNNELLKKYVLKVKEGQINPMTLRKIQPDRYIKNEKYYILTEKNGQLREIKLKKASILSLVKDDYKSKIKDYAKSDKLRFNNVDDVSKILNFYNSI